MSDYRSIPFFVDTITIRPHTATKAGHIGRRVSVRQFANGRPCRLLQNEETNEYLISIGDGGCPGYQFIEGPEV